MGVPVLEALGPDFMKTFQAWMADRKRPSLTLDHSTGSIVSYVMQHAVSQDKNLLDMLYPDCVFN
jgi:hypothetical protein